MDKKLIALIIVIVGTLLVFGGWWLTQSDDSTAETTEVTQQEEDGITEPEIVAEFTVAEIAVHNTETDCWTYIGGSVYDITPYIAVHPGGVEILRACGGDGSSLFTSRTTDDGETVGSGTPHSSDAYSQLGPFFIGNLAI